MLEIAVFGTPVLIVGLLSYLAGRDPWPMQMILWVFALPILLLAAPFITAIVSYLVFGIDLFD